MLPSIPRFHSTNPKSTNQRQQDEVGEPKTQEAKSMLSWAAIKANHSAISTRRYRYMKRNGRKKTEKRPRETKIIRLGWGIRRGKTTSLTEINEALMGERGTHSIGYTDIPNYTIQHYTWGARRQTNSYLPDTLCCMYLYVCPWMCFCICICICVPTVAVRRSRQWWWSRRAACLFAAAEISTPTSIDTRVAISSQGAIYRPHSPAVSLSLSASPSLSGAAEKMVLYIQISDARPIIWNWYITIKFLMYYVLSILTGLYGI